MSLGLDDKSSNTTGKYYTSPTYTEAVNDAQFVRQFGLAALVTFFLMLLVPAIIIGVGLAVLGFGKTAFYRVLGIVVIIIGFLSPPSGSALLCIGVGWRGIEVLATLAKEGKGDPDWESTRKQAIVGIVFCSIVLLFSAVWITIVLVRFFLASHN